MFKWVDYEQNSALFIEGINVNVAVLRHKDFQLHDNTTGKNIKMKSSCLDEAKVDAINFLLEYWKNVYKELGEILEWIQYLYWIENR